MDLNNSWGGGGGSDHMGANDEGCLRGKSWWGIRKNIFVVSGSSTRAMQMEQTAFLSTCVPVFPHRTWASLFPSQVHKTNTANLPNCSTPVFDKCHQLYPHSAEGASRPCSLRAPWEYAPLPRQAHFLPTFTPDDEPSPAEELGQSTRSN